MSDGEPTAEDGRTGGLTRQDLVRLMDQAVYFLQANRHLATDEVLLKAQGLLEQAGGMTDILAAGLGVTREQVGNLLEVARRVLEVERNLVKTDLSDRLIATLTRLKGRPLVLNTIVALMQEGK